ncbi:MAG TPA: hypothetical protein VH092_02455 [Urbifossiella sp.]|jgi:hypothetical protein|nr:hypothetical protein [Urbifossiella sp.]
MLRSAVPAVLILALAGPAIAQQPAPAQPVPARPAGVPAQPVPVQPLPPGQPGFTFQVQDFAIPGGRAQGGAGAPRLVVAKVNDGALVWSSQEVVPVNRQIDVPVIENGQQVIRKTVITTMQPMPKESSIPLDNLKFKDMAGKKIQPLTLEIRLGKGAGVVLYSGTLPDEIRSLLKDDAILVELPPGMQPFAMPAPVGQPIFRPVVMPPGGAPPAVVPQPGAAPALPRTAPPAPGTAPAPGRPTAPVPGSPPATRPGTQPPPAPATAPPQP